MKSKVGSVIMAGYRAVVEPARAWRLRRPRLALYGLGPEDALPSADVDPYRGEGCSRGCSFHSGAKSVAVDLYLDRAEPASSNGPFGRIARGLRRRPRLTPTAIEVARYPDMTALEAVIRKRSSRTLPKARKAREAGYAVRRFAYPRHAADVEAVRGSTSVRAGGPVLAYWLADKDLPEPPRGKERLKRPGCDRHWTQWWGVFMPEPGRGERGERLVAYVKINRRGDLAHYADIMGHAAHLDRGVMVLLHLELMRLFIEGGDPMVEGVRIVLYGGAEHGGEGLLIWKKRAGFEPMRLVEAPRSGSGDAPKGRRF